MKKKDQIRNNPKVPFKNRNKTGILINDNEVVISKRGTGNSQYVKDLYYIYATLELQIT
jgi:hypothetical protein